jgi:hypothetical protein
MALRLIMIGLLAAGLPGCGSMNTFLARSMGDYIPAWAGGLPPNAPPRPDSPGYDAYQKSLRKPLEDPSANPEAKKAATQ